MKKYYYLVAVLGFGIAIQAQSFQSTVYGVELQSLDYLNEVCPPSTGSGGLGFQGMDEISQASAERIVDQMLSDMGITNKYKVRECKEIAKGNAKAQAFFEDNRIRRYIIYDVDFLKEIANSTETNYAAMFVLAHEVGHHINDHTLNNKGSNVSIEIEADVFAGTQLAMSGANLEQTLRTPRDFKKILTGPYDDHPGRMDRMRAAFDGWMKFAKNDSLVLSANAAYIKEYHDEMGEYQRLRNERNKPKSTITKNEKDVKNNTSDIPKSIAEPIAETKKEKEQNDAAEVLQGYFKALGGIAKVNSIKTMSFNELTDVDGNAQLNFHYNQKSPTLLVITNNIPGYEGERFKISNDSLYHMLNEKKGWKLGVPPNSGNNEEDFKEMISSSTGDFLEDFKLYASPSLVALKEEVNFEGELCYRLEVKEVLEDTYLDKRGTGEKVFMKQNRYYRLSDGLLHATEEIRKIQRFRKNKPDARETKRTITVHKDYQEIDGLKFPLTYKITNSTLEGAEEYVDQVITKTVSEIEVTFEGENL